MEIFLNSLREMWLSFLQISPQLLIALLVFIVMVWIGRRVGRLVAHLMSRGEFRSVHRSFFRNLTAWLFALLGLFAALNILGLKSLAASLLAGGGVTAIALGFAFRGIGENFLAGFFLAFSRPFEVGHLIQSGEFQGTVRAIDLRSTHIRSADGRDIYIPSSQIFGNPLVNFTKDGLRRLSFRVGIDYGDDSAEARRLLLERTKTVENVLADPSPGTLIASLAPQFVELEVFFWIDTFQQGVQLGVVRNGVMEQARRVLKENGFTFSSDVSTNMALGGRAPVEISMVQS